MRNPAKCYKQAKGKPQGEAGTDQRTGRAPAGRAPRGSRSLLGPQTCALGAALGSAEPGGQPSATGPGSSAGATCSSHPGPAPAPRAFDHKEPERMCLPCEAAALSRSGCLQKRCEHAPFPHGPPVGSAGFSRGTPGGPTAVTCCPALGAQCGPLPGHGPRGRAGVQRADVSALTPLCGPCPHLQSVPSSQAKLRPHLTLTVPAQPLAPPSASCPRIRLLWGPRRSGAGLFH